jgi:hypothetical protein
MQTKRKGARASGKRVAMTIIAEEIAQKIAKGAKKKGSG